MFFVRFVAFAAGCLLFVSCAGPQLRAPKPSQATVESERQYQQDLVFKQNIEAQIRLFRVYSRIRTSGAELCGKNVKPFFGLFLKDLNSFPPDERDRAARVIGIDHSLRVLAAGTPATDAGIRQGDVVRKIGGTVLERSYIASSSEVQRGMQILEKATLSGSVEVEVKRPEGNVTFAITPKLACRFGIILENDRQVNAKTDGENITMFMGMVKFATPSLPI